jgi:multiple sugar transport system ATP-binding protein
MAEVILKNVTKVYNNEVTAVNDASFKIEDKEFVVLVGPSGCGKSTTLRMIAGLEEITDGELIIDDKIVNNVPPKDRDIAMVFQNYALYPHMTVYENMAFGLKLRKFKKAEIEERVNYAAEILGLDELLKRKPKELSGGQRQRVALGRAIVRKPKVFLFDEPLSNLDAKLRVQTRTEISKLHSKLGVTMIYVTHDQTEAMTMGDKIVIMKDGIINQIDSPLNLYNKPTNKFVAGFIGSPSMNFVKGELKKNGEYSFVSEDGKMNIKLSKEHSEKLKNYNGKKITLGIRPEDISMQDPEGNNSHSIKVKLEVVEPMGNEIFIYFIVSGEQLIARLPSTADIKKNEELDIYMNINRIHFFDDETEESLLK